MDEDIKFRIKFYLAVICAVCIMAIKILVVVKVLTLIF
jgi:hypothetical protein